MAGLIVLSLLRSLGLTLVIELAVSLILGVRSFRDILLVGLVNVLTNPLVGLTLDLFWLNTMAMPPWYLILLLEILAVAAEGLLYRRRMNVAWNPFLFSLILNGCSFLGGLFV